MPNPVYLEPQAKAVADANANPPYVFELGSDQGRRTVDEVQSGPVEKPDRRHRGHHRARRPVRPGVGADPAPAARQPDRCR